MYFSLVSYFNVQVAVLKKCAYTYKIAPGVITRKIMFIVVRLLTKSRKRKEESKRKKFGFEEFW